MGSETAADIEAKVREAERDHREAEEQRKQSIRSLEELYRDRGQYAKRDDEKGIREFTDTVAAVALTNRSINQERKRLAQAEMRATAAEQRLEELRRQRDERRETQRQADQEDRQRLRNEMEEHRKTFGDESPAKTAKRDLRRGRDGEDMDREPI